jgi:hypothetical protein
MGMAVTVNRVDVSPPAGQELGTYDYADSFEVHTAQPDSRPAAAWLHAGLEGSPPALRWLIVIVHRHALRFRLGSYSGDQMLGLWRIVKLEDDDARLEADGPLITGRLVATRRDPYTARLDTYVTFNNRTAAAVVWALAGPLHRTIAPRLMARAARGAQVAAE